MYVLLYLDSALLPCVQGGILDFFKSKVCYDVIGCFDNSAPFNNSWHELPDSPDKVGVTLTLYTRSSPLRGEPLNYKQPKSVVGTHFDPRADTKVIIHGYLDDGTAPWVLNMTRALLQVVRCLYICYSINLNNATTRGRVGLTRL